MSINPPSSCAFCNGPWDPEEKRLCIIPKAWAHERCMLEMEAKDPTLNNMWNMADSIPCCPARISLKLFGGTIVQKFNEIPSDEIWFPNHEKKIEIYMIKPNGMIELAKDRMPIKNKQDDHGSNYYPNRIQPPAKES